MHQPSDSLSDLKQLPIVTESGAQITLGTVADLKIANGPPMLRSENARLSGWIYVDLRGRDLQSAVEEMQARVARDGMITAPLLSLFVIPAVYRMMRRRELITGASAPTTAAAH